MKSQIDNNIKIRVALLLDEQTNNAIKLLNKEVNKQINAEIVFGEQCLPHITLISGVLTNKNDLDKICKIINEETNETRVQNLSIELNEFYCSTDNKWMFLKIEDNEKLQLLIQRLRQKLNSYLIISDSRKLHITIAKSAEEENMKKIIDKLNVPTRAKLESVCVGLSGTNGTLLNVIKNF